MHIKQRTPGRYIITLFPDFLKETLLPHQCPIYVLPIPSSLTSKIEAHPFCLGWNARNNTILEVSILQEKLVTLRYLLGIFLWLALRVPQGRRIRRAIREEDADPCFAIVRVLVAWPVVDIFHRLALPHGELVRGLVADGLTGEIGERVEFFRVVDFNLRLGSETNCCCSGRGLRRSFSGHGRFAKGRNGRLRFRKRRSCCFGFTERRGCSLLLSSRPKRRWLAKRPCSLLLELSKWRSSLRRLTKAAGCSRRRLAEAGSCRRLAKW